MCGITGYVGSLPAQELLLAGLEQLEYRGYDSAGIAVLDDAGRAGTVRTVGNLAALRDAVAERVLVPSGGRFEDAPTIGIGHTRWATHGGVTEENAHPHTDSAQRVHIVLNGIIENHGELRRRLAADGAIIRSETDAEVLAHLVAHHYDGSLPVAVRRALGELDGHYAFVVMSADEPGMLVAGRRDCPLVVGVAEHGHFVASAIPAFLEHTRDVREVADGELVVVTADSVRFLDEAGAERADSVTVSVDWQHEVAEKGGYESFMRKEIAEQPDAVAAALSGRLVAAGVALRDEHFTLDADELRQIDRLRIVACGTSYHAGMFGRYVIEEWAQIPVELDVASEYRYRNAAVSPRELVLGITQSGETADTLAAMRLARRRGATVVAITNAMGSQATRDADAVLFTRAGTEIGVAATKTFTNQVVTLVMLALHLGIARGELSEARARELADGLGRLPVLMRAVTEAAAPWAAKVAHHWSASDFCMFLGRHAGLPIALEGALKLKEVAYIPCDAYPAGEMKHGPIALLSKGTPVVCVATDSPVLGKLQSNIAEVRARGACVLAIAGARGSEFYEYVDEMFLLPACEPLLQAILAVIPLQLLAHQVAVNHGLNVDQPRNLAKTVTVE